MKVFLFLLVAFLVESVPSFFFSGPLSFSLDRFLGWERVFFLFFLITFLVESVFSCFLTFLFSFINSHLWPGAPGGATCNLSRDWGLRITPVNKHSTRLARPAPLASSMWLPFLLGSAKTSFSLNIKTTMSKGRLEKDLQGSYRKVEGGGEEW